MCYEAINLYVCATLQYYQCPNLQLRSASVCRDTLFQSWLQIAYRCDTRVTLLLRSISKIFSQVLRNESNRQTIVDIHDGHACDLLQHCFAKIKFATFFHKVKVLPMGYKNLEKNDDFLRFFDFDRKKFMLRKFSIFQKMLEIRWTVRRECFESPYAIVQRCYTPSLARFLKMDKNSICKLHWIFLKIKN